MNPSPSHVPSDASSSSVPGRAVPRLRTSPVVIHRTFLPWSEPPLPVAARLLVDEHAADGTSDLEGLIVVLPAARAGRRLLELLVDEAERRELVLLPPRTTTLGALPEQLYEPSAPLADEILARRVWSRALRSLEPDARSIVFPDPPDDGDLAAWDRIARMIHRLHREVAGEGLDFGDVAGACRKMGTDSEADRWRALAGAQAAYGRRLAALDRVDRDAARIAALEEGRVGAEKDLWLLGVVELPAVARRMLEAAASGSDPARIMALVHAPEHRADAFDELGCVRTDAWRETEVRVPDEVVVACGRPPSQADAALRCLANGGRRLAPDEVAVGVPDERLVPYLEQRFEAYGVPHRYAAGTPLARTDPFRFLAAIADYLDGRRFEHLAALLRHPALEGRLDAPAPQDAADRYFERHLPARVPRNPKPGGGPDPDFSRLQSQLHETLGLERLRGDASVDGWMAEILRLLARVYGGEAVDRSTRSGRRLVATLETIRDAAAALGRLPGHPDDEPERIGASAAIRLLLAEIRDASLPPLPERAAVEMLGWLELHLDDAPVLVLTGLDDEHVPGALGADLFLPARLRTRLGLPDNDDRYARDAYLLSAILASREEVHVLVGRRDAEGNPLRPSRLLLAERGDRLARRARRLFAEEEPAAPPLPRLGLRAEGESDFRTPPEPVLRVDDPPVDLRVTDFGLLLKDPYRWVLERELRLRTRDDRARELDGAGFGNLAHRVLHAFGEDPAAASDDPDTVRDRLDALLDRACGQRFGGDALSAVRVQAEQLRARLGAFAEWQAGRVAAGWETVAVEVETPEDGVPFDVDGAPVRLHGRIDRIDRHAETGRWAVLDYKSSDRPATPDDHHRRGRRPDAEWVDLQLPLYRHLVSALAEHRPELRGLADAGSRLGLGYLLLSREGVQLAPADWSEDELAAADEAARRAVRALRAGEFAFREDDFLTFRDDPFGPLLGKRRLVAADPGGGAVESDAGEDEGAASDDGDVTDGGRASGSGTGGAEGPRGGGPA